MSVIFRYAALLLFLISCQNKTEVASPQTGEAPYFSPREIVSTMVVLVAIIDWPQETIAHQKNLSVKPEDAQKLMLPLHPLYDEKVSEVASQIPGWSKEQRDEAFSNCSKQCECSFYQDIFDRHQELTEQGIKFSNPESANDPLHKKRVMSCLEKLPSLQSVLTFLRTELKNYEAESAY